MPAAVAVPKPAGNGGLTVDEAYRTDRTGWEYITIPTENAIGNIHDNISLVGPKSHQVYQAGQTYHVPPVVAAYLKERLAVYARSQVRVLQPKRDTVAENAIAVGTQRSVQSVDATQVNTNA